MGAATAQGQGPPPIVWSGPGHISVRSVATDGQLLATGSFVDQTVKLWDLATGKLLRTLAGHDSNGHYGGVNAVDFSADGQWVASCGEFVFGIPGWNVKLWNAATGALVRNFATTNHCFAVDLSPDGSLLAAVNGRDVRIFRVSDGALLRELIGSDTWYAMGVALSPDGQYVAAASADHNVYLWRLSDGLLLHVLAGHTSIATSVAFSPDGGMLASGSYDGQVRPWQVPTGASLGVLNGHLDGVLGRLLARRAEAGERGQRGGHLAVAPARLAADRRGAGQSVVSGSSDGHPRRWPPATAPRCSTWCGRRTAGERRRAARQPGSPQRDRFRGRLRARPVRPEQLTVREGSPPRRRGFRSCLNVARRRCPGGALRRHTSRVRLDGLRGGYVTQLGSRPLVSRSCSKLPAMRAARTTLAVAAAALLCGCGIGLPDPVVAPVFDSEFHPINRGWSSNPVWEDDFIGTQLDTAKWVVAQFCGGYNEELQCYTNRPRNLRVSGGHLTITACLEFPQVHNGYQRCDGTDISLAMANNEVGTVNCPATPGDVPLKDYLYSSARIHTRVSASTHAWTYGRIEIRARMPYGQGTWPAFWMLPLAPPPGFKWPQSGEIDILETVDLGKSIEQNDFVQPNVHLCSNTTAYGYTVVNSLMNPCPPGYDRVQSEQKLLLGAFAGTAPNLTAAFHTYAVEWTEDRMRFFVDGQVLGVVMHGPLSDSTNNWAPFQHPFYLIINLAIGGEFPPDPPKPSTWASSNCAPLDLDWVRVYTCVNDPTAKNCAF